MYILNIGLNIRKSNKQNSYKKTLFYLIKYIKKIKKIKIVHSYTEKTIVVYFEIYNFLNLLRLSIVLKQDCIAVYNIRKETGKLVGFIKWGKFNSTLFLFDDDKPPRK
jgi:hypothetical protein